MPGARFELTWDFSREILSLLCKPFHHPGKIDILRPSPEFLRADRQGTGALEAAPGIEPGYEDLQSPA